MLTLVLDEDLCDVTLPKWSKIGVSILVDFEGEIRYEEETVFNRTDRSCFEAG